MFSIEFISAIHYFANFSLDLKLFWHGLLLHINIQIYFWVTMTQIHRQKFSNF